MDGALIGYQRNVGRGSIIKLVEQQGLTQDVRGYNQSFDARLSAFLVDYLCWN